MSPRLSKTLIWGLAIVGLIWAQSVLGADGDPEKGRTIYENNCMVCHGPTGMGDGPVAKDLMTRPANLTSEDVRNDPDDELFGIIRNGTPGTSMPAWKNDLSEQQILDVLAYVRTLSQENSDGY